VAACLASAARHDNSVVFVRRLEFDWTVDAGWDPEVIAHVCALVLARDLLDEIATDTTGNVIRFSGPPEYLASYVLWRARDLSAQPWFYAPLEGWAALPPSAAIRAALCDNSEIGRAALAVLSPDSLAQVARVLTGHDAEAIVRALAELSRGEPCSSGIRAVLVSTLSWPPPPSVLDRDGLIVWLLARSPASDISSLRVAARILRIANNSSRELSGRDFQDALASICDESMTEAIAAAAAGDDSHLRARIAERVGNSTATVSEATEHGGVFLIVDVIRRDVLERATQGMPELLGTAAADLLTFIVLCQCFGTETWKRIFEDPFWRNSLRIAPAIDIASISEWFRGAAIANEQRLRRVIEADDDSHALPTDLDSVIDRSGVLPSRWSEICGAAAARAVRRFARRLPGFADASCPHLWRNMLDMSAAVDQRKDRVTVRLSRPPLDLILQICGQTRGERRWPWLDPRPFFLVSGD
jgi:hypothetical protein